MKYSREKFDPTAEYVVAKKLLFGGRTFQIGENFDVGATERQKRTLYNGRFLSMGPAEPAPYPEDPIEPVVETQDKPDDDTSTDPIKEDNQETPPERKIVQAGRGWYNVEDASGNLVNTKKLRLKDAEKLLTQ